jgi:hypothetical protein
MTDDERDLHRPLRLAVGPQDVRRVVGRVGHEPDLPRALQLVPEDAGVEPAGLRVAGDRRRRRDVLAGVELLVDEHRQLCDVDLIARPDDLMDRRLVGRDDGGRDRAALAPGVLRDHAVDVAADAQGDPLVRAVEVEHERDRRLRDVLEQDRREAGVGRVVEDLVDDGGRLELGVDLVVDHADRVRGRR